MAEKIKTAIKKYLSETVVIFLGISISFWFDEWRDYRKDRATEREILTNLRENLLQDTLVLTRTIQGAEVILAGVHRLIVAPNAPQTADSLSFFIDNAASYLGFNANQSIYEEIKQTGRTLLIQDDTLKKAIMAHYTSILPFVKEWGETDKNHTMTQLIPEMSTYFPVVLDTTNAVSTAAKIKALSNGRLRNLLLTNHTYKTENVKVFKFALQQTKAILRRIDKVLAKSQ